MWPKPEFPLYIPSKGRAQYMITSKALTRIGVRHSVVVEPQEAKEYRAAAKDLLCDIVVLDLSYKERYELCDDLGLTKSTGPGPARNFIWEHSIAQGHEWHWVMDDNISTFYRLNRNMKTPIGDGTSFHVMEDFVLRYRNVAMAGPNYECFTPRKEKHYPFIANTRIYSCNLIRNDVPFRWRGRYNEDTILSLDMLKAGWCTVQFNAFLQKKLETQLLRGGNTAEFYHAEGEIKPGQKYASGGTTAKSEMLVKVHPDVSRLAWRFGRVHHHVDYRPFRKNRLIKREGLEVPAGTDNYGMSLKVIE
ncbi:hypothetical protein [Roseibium alexandrii]|uniref:TET-Associated Glycosyltransferase domain-containing protein n=1 Tax=Roseibium alexandrii TaxID=388408 RepID=A0A0M6ZYP3_9HYPH|nr:hypothetical protein [Roseibium alexandrii]CTQ67160.1 hypothetical protein LAX5112_01240 [Roseibium alexandrii]